MYKQYDRQRPQDQAKIGQHKPCAKPFGKRRYDMTDDIIPHPLYTVSLNFKDVLSGTQAEEIGTLLEDHVVSVLLHNHESADGDRWSVTLTTYNPPDTGVLIGLLDSFANEKGLAPLLTQSDITFEKLPEKDWLRHVHDNFPPVEAGRFFIYGSHYDGAKPDHLLPLCIDAATAFGSGEHETTKGCLTAFDKLAAENTFKNALDMGCGSGILAIGITKIWPDAKVVAVDIDPESIIVTERHAQMNACNTAIKTEAGDGYAAVIVAENAPYDLIAANILAGPLMDMAPDLEKYLAPGGYCVLSGLLGRQEAEVTAAHTVVGLLPVHSITVGEWRALVLQKPLA
jgi:ribosomal protein L11 methyltransferase